jgi:DNA-binding SARP family transcriptional activator
MSLTIQLLGRPRLVRDGTDSYEFRSRKSWAVLAYLALRERPPSRSQLAALLFCGADDPVRACGGACRNPPRPGRRRQ